MDHPAPSYLALALIVAGAALMAVNVVRFGRVRRFARECVSSDHGRLGLFIVLHQGLMALFLLCCLALLGAWLTDSALPLDLAVAAMAFLGAAMAASGARLQYRLLGSLRRGYRDMVSMYSSLEDGKERMGRLGERLDRERSERQRFEEADRLKSAFLTDASRQIREPVHSLLEHAGRIRDLVHGEGHAENGADDSPEALLDEMTWRLEAVIRDGRKVDRMCRDMHGLASDVDRHILDTQQVVSLGDVLRAAARDTARTLAEQGGAEFTSEVPESLPAMRMDPAMLARMVRSLLDHVTRRASQGTVHLSGATRADGRVRVSVRNVGGAPLTVEELDAMRGGGRGNDGLSECRHDASRFGGRVWSEDDPDAGSVVYLEFPASVRVTPD